MSVQAFGAFITHESGPTPGLSGPAAVVHKDSITSVTPAEHEFDELQWGRRLNGPRTASSRNASPTGRAVPLTPDELERSQPATPKRDHAVDAIVHSASNPPRNRWRLAASCVMFFVMGLNDAATGALIPYLEEEYSIGYAIVSLIFITNALGFISVTPFIQRVEARLGRSRCYLVATAMMSAGYIAIVCTPPFPVVVLSFYFLGCGMGVFLAMTNTFIVNLVNGTVILGFCHGLYGLGGIVSPLIATNMVSSGIHWAYFYFIPLSLAVFSFFFMGWSFLGFEKDAAVQLLSSLQRTASRQATTRGEPTKKLVLRKAVRSKTTLLGAVFIFFYQGAEVAISGWVISYLIHYRRGDPSHVGNVTSGFWGGITVGRFILTHFAQKIGEKVAVVVLIIGAAVCQLLVWLVPNIVGNAVAESIVGLFLGPIYPCATAIFARLLPRDIQISSLSVVTSMGSSGGALVPFITGILAQKLSTVVLHPVVLISFGAMTMTWLLLPRIGKRAE
ncbi:hypothetical protein A1O7_08422 [Cladophialophora yegresii CBS 114405]|uniref:Major facilitator superfamily (MFS) profile domain-containing protein n=1 Tax=Cladophialophora yegresii CBS 114405 TaxID=1182544 RepID=W9VR57_9EURO|nr:uncharacterized protein A1O7_08422 [Cladophialophora yegresii CBS 114405]EXJ55495.1 hypothetical protein A1O7_08422 [Cladophialophora yegresii CBS 114405]